MSDVVVVHQLTETGAMSPSHGVGQEMVPARPRRVALFGLAAAAGVMLLSLTAFVGGFHGGHAGARIGQIAPAFSLRDADGIQHALTQFDGRHVVLLFPSRGATGVHAQLPALVRELADTAVPENLVIVAVKPDDAPAPAFERLAELTGREVIQVVDRNLVVSERYAVEQQPTAVTVGPDRRIVDRGPASEVIARLAAASSTVDLR